MVLPRSQAGPRSNDDAVGHPHPFIKHGDLARAGREGNLLLIVTCERWSDSVECTLKVLLFASAREAVGRGELTVPYSRGESLADLLGRLRDDYPSLAKMSHYRFALNGEFVSGDLARVRLENAVELALLPPYSGG